MDREIKIMIIGIILFLIWDFFLALMIFVSASSANLCPSCEFYIPYGYVLKITTLKASDKNTLERWVNDFVDNHEVIKINNSKFPEFVTLYHIEEGEIITETPFGSCCSRKYKIKKKRPK